MTAPGPCPVGALAGGPRGRRCGLGQVFVAAGTSLRVQPAAGLVEVAADHGAGPLIVRAEPTPYDGIADEVIRQAVGTALLAVLRGLGVGNGS